MPHISFIHPVALWLLLLLIPVWALALFVPRRLSPLRFWSSLGFRTVLLLLLVFSLAGTQLVHGVGHMTTVFLIDSSDSISPQMRSHAERFVQEALAHKDVDDRAAVVVFGDNALVERAPTDSALLGRLRSQPLVTRTDIEEAVNLGLALFPADTQKRLVLLSDGGENSGQAQQAAQLAATRRVPIDVVDLASDQDSAEALVTALHAPDSVRDGQEIGLVATVESSVAQAATLHIFADQEIVVSREVQLEVGTNEFRATVQADGQGFRRYRAQIEPQQDNRIQNNESAVMVEVQGPPRVLLVEGTRGEAASFRNALQAANLDAVVMTPTEMPIDLTGLSSYEAVVLVNVAARDLPVQVVAALPTYVRDLGRGLVMVGGDESFGVGGYGETPIEAALPVYMDVRDREERPDLALMFVIDKSGSMDACHCAGPNRSSPMMDQNGERKIDIAKEAVTQATTLLSDRDTVGIVTFDTSAHWTLPATQGVSADEVADSVSSVMPRGDTNVRSGLLAAEGALNETDARIKHVILLTDGWGEGGSNLDVAQRMQDEGITLSVVAAGSGSAAFLENLALTGGGRYYPVEDMAEVPEIFLQETIIAAGNYIVERPFFPTSVGDSVILQQLDDGFPALYGYNGSTLKDTAQNVLVTDDQSPLLAQWQYGLGRSIAWTSDTKGQWAQDWVTWEAFPRFAAQMVGWVIPASDAHTIDTSIEVAGGQTTVAAVVSDNQGGARDDLYLSAALLSSNEQNEDDTSPSQVELVQVAPGEYRANLTTPEPGTYFVQIRGQDGDGRDVLRHVAGLVVPYSSEYRPGQANPALLASLMQLTDGSTLAEPEMAFAGNLPPVTRAQEVALPLLLLALLLLPFDIAVRRVLLRRRDFADVRSWMQHSRLNPRAESASTPESMLTRLAKAKGRAGTSRTSATPVQGTQPDARPAPSAPPREHAQVAKPAAPAAPPQASRPAGVARPPAEQGSGDADPLERLRLAKERARRRARGEEE